MREDIIIADNNNDIKSSAHSVCGNNTFNISIVVNILQGLCGNMGVFISQLWWGGDPDTVNPFSGLSRRDVYLVQKTWAPLYNDIVETGSELFKRLFREYPETKLFFKMFRDLPEEDLGNSHQFKAHVINLMSSLNLAITNLNQPEVTAALMNKLGESHGKRKIQEQHFINLKDIMMNMLNELLKFDETTQKSWSKTIDFIYKHIFETLH